MSESEFLLYATFQSSLVVQSYGRLFNILTNDKTALGVYSVAIPTDLVGTSLIGWLKI